MPGRLKLEISFFHFSQKPFLGLQLRKWIRFTSL